ncbi:NAD(P)/FAD-dependent oxidoreductase [Metabacillus endolithicus]|uniref:NAD(P)/FAD-dependent oxidoreductase n=1 Tax=Metabacillus endolithicus TaxID=1535204 RepID=A0ABW5C7E6_9BACI|nr:FAD-dependent oxidoreductase [Metabacillus endolithicus]UPG62111.1 FAD-dependent oxidoreductase [Metabacillus endolithicus]
MLRDVVIIGGGLTGVMAARTLKENGIDDVLVIDKGKSLGGRMATRRIGEGRVDHGAQFFTVRTKHFQSFVEELEKNDFVSKWFGKTYSRYKSNNGMNSLVKKLGENLEVKLNTKVINIHKIEDYYLLQAECNTRIAAKAVILTAPVPQSTELLHNLKIDHTLTEMLEKVTYNPCFVLIASLSNSSDLPEIGFLNENLPDGVDRIVDHRKKGISRLTTLSMYTSGEWAKDYYHLEDHEIKALLLENLKPVLQKENIIELQLKRWKYSEATSTIKHPFLNLEQTIPLFLAGDVFLHKDDLSGKTRVESAFLSGVAVGEEVARRMLEE